MEFEAWPKIRRAKDNGIIVTEKIDGTNAQIAIEQDGTTMHVGSRSRWCTPDDDNFGFAQWAADHRDELLTLGPGRHYGEWWGPGIQRGYGVAEKRFSIFNVFRPADSLPACVRQVPVLYRGESLSERINHAFEELARTGSIAAPGFMRPEGIVVYSFLTKTRFKRTFGGDCK
jgi:hypothetical protein